MNPYYIAIAVVVALTIGYIWYRKSGPRVALRAGAPTPTDDAAPNVANDTPPQGDPGGNIQPPIQSPQALLSLNRSSTALSRAVMPDVVHTMALL